MAELEPRIFRAVLANLRPNAAPDYLAKAADRFLSSFDRRGVDECWPWTGSTRRSGYGSFSVGGRPAIQATQIMLRAVKGEPPILGAFALHSCDNPNCVNPAHLRWGTAKDNADDREARGRSVKPRGEAHGRAKLTEADVRFIRSCGLSLSQLEAKFPLSRRTLWKARAGKTWRHVECRP